MMRRFLAAAAVSCCVLFGGAANAAYVRTGNLVLRADGSFTPLKLPRKAYVPIAFQGHADLDSVDGSVPTPIEQIVLDFDRDGRLGFRGLAVCHAASLQEATPAQARKRCSRAIVGKGKAGALIAVGRAQVLVSSPITLFNGPRTEGTPTVILHARTPAPAVQNFVITIPIERHGGLYRYRATIDVPPIAGGHGALAHIYAKIGRRYRFGGRKRSYVAARCGDGIFRTHGRFTFADGVVIDGSVEKPCTYR